MGMKEALSKGNASLPNLNTPISPTYSRKALERPKVEYQSEEQIKKIQEQLFADENGKPIDLTTYEKRYNNLDEKYKPYFYNKAELEAKQVANEDTVKKNNLKAYQDKAKELADKILSYNESIQIALEKYRRKSKEKPKNKESYKSSYKEKRDKYQERIELVEDELKELTNLSEKYKDKAIDFAQLSNYAREKAVYKRDRQQASKKARDQAKEFMDKNTDSLKQLGIKLDYKNPLKTIKDFNSQLDYAKSLDKWATKDGFNALPKIAQDNLDKYRGWADNSLNTLKDAGINAIRDPQTGVVKGFQDDVRGFSFEASQLGAHIDNVNAKQFNLPPKADLFTPKNQLFDVNAGIQKAIETKNLARINKQAKEQELIKNVYSQEWIKDSPFLSSIVDKIARNKEKDLKYWEGKQINEEWNDKYYKDWRTFEINSINNLAKFLTFALDPERRGETIPGRKEVLYNDLEKIETWRKKTVDNIQFKIDNKVNGPAYTQPAYYKNFAKDVINGLDNVSKNIINKKNVNFLINSRIYSTLQSPKDKIKGLKEVGGFAYDVLKEPVSSGLKGIPKAAWSVTNIGPGLVELALQQEYLDAVKRNDQEGMQKARNNLDNFYINRDNSLVWKTKVKVDKALNFDPYNIDKDKDVRTLTKGVITAGMVIPGPHQPLAYATNAAYNIAGTLNGEENELGLGTRVFNNPITGLGGIETAGMKLPARVIWRVSEGVAYALAFDKFGKLLSTIPAGNLAQYPLNYIKGQYYSKLYENAYLGGSGLLSQDSLKRQEAKMQLVDLASEIGGNKFVEPVFTKMFKKGALSDLELDLSKKLGITQDEYKHLRDVSKNGNPDEEYYSIKLKIDGDGLNKDRLKLSEKLFPTIYPSQLEGSRAIDKSWKTRLTQSEKWKQRDIAKATALQEHYDAVEKANTYLTNVDMKKKNWGDNKKQDYLNMLRNKITIYQNKIKSPYFYALEDRSIPIEAKGKEELTESKYTSRINEEEEKLKELLRIKLEKEDFLNRKIEQEIEKTNLLGPRSQSEELEITRKRADEAAKSREKIRLEIEDLRKKIRRGEVVKSWRDTAEDESLYYLSNKLVSPIEKQLGFDKTGEIVKRDLPPTVYTPEEYAKKLEKDKKIIFNILNSEQWKALETDPSYRRLTPQGILLSGNKGVELGKAHGITNAEIINIRDRKQFNYNEEEYQRQIAHEIRHFIQNDKSINFGDESKIPHKLRKSEIDADLFAKDIIEQGGFKEDNLGVSQKVNLILNPPVKETMLGKRTIVKYGPGPGQDSVEYWDEALKEAERLGKDIRVLEPLPQNQFNIGYGRQKGTKDFYLESGEGDTTKFLRFKESGNKANRKYRLQPISEKITMENVKDSKGEIIPKQKYTFLTLNPDGTPKSKLNVITDVQNAQRWASKLNNKKVPKLSEEEFNVLTNSPEGLKKYTEIITKNKGYVKYGNPIQTKTTLIEVPGTKEKDILLSRLGKNFKNLEVTTKGKYIKIDDYAEYNPSREMKPWDYADKGSKSTQQFLESIYKEDFKLDKVEDLHKRKDIINDDGTVLKQVELEQTKPSITIDPLLKIPTYVGGKYYGQDLGYPDSIQNIQSDYNYGKLMLENPALKNSADMYDPFSRYGQRDANLNKYKYGSDVYVKCYEPEFATTSRSYLEHYSPTLEISRSPNIEEEISKNIQESISPTIESTISPTIEQTITPTIEETVKPTITPSPTVVPNLNIIPYRRYLQQPDPEKPDGRLYPPSAFRTRNAYVPIGFDYEGKEIEGDKFETQDDAINEGMIMADELPINTFKLKKVQIPQGMSLKKGRNAKLGRKFMYTNGLFIEREKYQKDRPRESSFNWMRYLRASY